MKVIKNNKVTWIDILNPTREDIEFLKKLHKFHPVVLDELLHPSARSRVEKYDGYLFLTYHLPIYDRAIRTSRKAEVDFLITKNEVITVHYETLEPLDAFFRTLNNNPHLRGRVFENTARLVYGIIEEIIDFSMRQLRHVEENISFATQEIFKGQEQKMLEKISYIKRDILDYTLISRPQEILLESFVATGAAFWGEQAKVYLSDLVGDYSKVAQRLENYAEVIESLEATNAQLLSARTNAVMQRFTILAFLTFPWFLYTSFFQIFKGSAADFWVGFSVVFAITLVVLGVFRKKGWL
jgi:magnesium transporter